jgi:2-polyprenyl-3-methyl-5-hydroxy-6-metoxy-1,4-benzoquinol methylase
LNLNLAELYRKSTFDYSSEQQSLADTYEEVLKVALEQADVTRGGVLEVGGGNGFFLERALTLGFKSVVGVEPSTHAIASAREDIRPSMIASPMVPGLVESNSVDVGAMFHVLDHLVDPKETLTNCLDAIKTGGIMVVAVHNEKSWSARLFGRRSPIFDVEHTYLYSKKTLKGILEKSGFEVVLVKGYKNRYSLRYLVHLTPMPPRLKKALLSSRLWSHALNLRFWIPLGNIMAVGIKR